MNTSDKRFCLAFGGGLFVLTCLFGSGFLSQAHNGSPTPIFIGMFIAVTVAIILFNYDDNNYSHKAIRYITNYNIVCCQGKYIINQNGTNRYIYRASRGYGDKIYWNEHDINEFSPYIAVYFDTKEECVNWINTFNRTGYF